MQQALVACIPSDACTTTKAKAPVQTLLCMSVPGGLQAPDPNRPFQSRPGPTLPQAPHDTPKTQNTASQQSGDVQQSVTLANPQGSNAALTGSQASRAQTGAGARAAPAGGSAGVGLAQRGVQATPQARVLAKLGLSKGGHANRAGQQASTPGAALKSTAVPSGKSLSHGHKYDRRHEQMKCLKPNSSTDMDARMAKVR